MSAGSGALDARLTRRTLMAGMAALAVSGCAGAPGGAIAGPPVPGEAAPAGSIHAAAQSRGRRFGSMVAWNRPGVAAASFENPAYAAIMERDCHLVVCENEMKWQSLRPAPDRYNWAPADAIVAGARQRGMTMRGHTLMWHRPRWFPEWLNNYNYGARPASEAERLLVDHIDQVIGRYGGTIRSWDVVNETVDDATGALMETSMSRAMGSTEAVLDLAFHTARARAPDAELVYNDYMSWEPGHAAHRAGVLRLLEGFRRRGTPVDALGVQSHIEVKSIDPATRTGPYDEREWRAFLDAVVAMGYRLVITELDVKDNGFVADTAVRDAGVADYLRRYMDVMFAYPQLRDVLAWGMVDPFSWLQGFSPRADGLLLRGCPYDGDYRAKPMRDALIRSFATAHAL